MKMHPYLNYGGNCKEAFEFYAEHLGGTIHAMLSQSQQPDTSHVPAGQENAIMYACMTLGGVTLAGNDVPPEYFERMRSAYLSLILDSNEEAEQAYATLIEGGQILMKMDETFFAHRFAMVRDRFGTQWMLIHQKPMGPG